MLFRFRFEVLGGHVHTRVFAGEHEGALGNCGLLVMTTQEWQKFRFVVGTGTGDVVIQFLQEDT